MSNDLFTPKQKSIAPPQDFDAYSVGLVCASVCTSLSVEEATKRLNAEHMHPESSLRWKLSEDTHFRNGAKNGCRCELRPDTHRHYLFNC